MNAEEMVLKNVERKIGRNKQQQGFQDNSAHFFAMNQAQNQGEIGIKQNAGNADENKQFGKNSLIFGRDECLMTVDGLYGYVIK